MDEILFLEHGNRCTHRHTVGRKGRVRPSGDSRWGQTESCRGYQGFTMNSLYHVGNMQSCESFMPTNTFPVYKPASGVCQGNGSEGAGSN